MSLKLIVNLEQGYTLIIDSLNNQAIHTNGNIIFTGVTSFNVACFRDILPMELPINQSMTLDEFNTLEELREFLILQNMEGV